MLFHCHHCLLLYFKFSMSFLFTDEYDRLFGSLITSELLLWAVVLSPYIIIVFIPEQWRGFTVTVVDSYILNCYMIPLICWMQPLIRMDDSIGSTFLGDQIIDICHDFFSPITMVSFHRQHCWLLYFEIYMLFLLTDECYRLFGSLFNLEILS